MLALRSAKKPSHGPRRFKMSKHPRNIRKVIKMVHSLPVGSRFAARHLQKETGLPSDEIGNVLRWQPNVRIRGCVHGLNINEWEKWRDYTPEEMIVK